MWLTPKKAINKFQNGLIFSVFFSYFFALFQCRIRTRQSFKSGRLTWFLVFIILLLFFPLAFVPFLIDSCKDVRHYCPKCNMLLSVKKRFFFWCVPKLLICLFSHFCMIFCISGRKARIMRIFLFVVLDEWAWKQWLGPPHYADDKSRNFKKIVYICRQAWALEQRMESPN